MDCPKFINPNQKEESISIQRVNTKQGLMWEALYKSSLNLHAHIPNEDSVTEILWITQVFWVIENNKFSYFWVASVLSLSFSLDLNFLMMVLLWSWDFDNFSPEKNETM